MQDHPHFFLIHGSIRYGMCSLSASLQFSDLSCTGSTPVIHQLCDETRQWTLIHQAVETSLHAGFEGTVLLNAISAGNQTMRQLCDEMQDSLQRWLSCANPKQRQQLGAILQYRFHEFMAHSLLHMNRCENIITGAGQPYSGKVVERIDQGFASLPVTADWVRRNSPPVHPVSAKDRLRWKQFVAACLPSAG